MPTNNWEFEERMSGGLSDLRDPDAPKPEVTPENPLRSRPYSEVEPAPQD